MPPSGSSLLSFAAGACKVALALTTLGYATSVARRMRAERAQLRAARAECEKLRAQVEEARSRAGAAEEEREERGEFWGRMDALARAELERRGTALREKDAALAEQRQKIDGLQARVRGDRDRDVDEARGTDRDADAEERSPAHPAATSPISEGDLPALRATISTTDETVLQMVRTLNFEISEVASRVTNAFRVADAPDAHKVAAAFERAREAVGPVMAELLESIHHQEDPILIDIALKADMVGFAAEVVSAWDFQHQSKSVFSGVYRLLRRSESQLTAGRWRAHARKYSKRRLYNGRDLAGDFAQQLAERVADLLTLARGAAASPDEVYAAHGPHVDAIARTALALQRVVGEDVVACDYEVLVVRIDDEFDAGAMEDIYNGEIGATGPPGILPRVLSTVDLGLRRTEKVAAEGGDGSGEVEAEGEDGIVTTMLLKPKVVLDTIVYELGLVDEDDASPASAEPPA